MKHLEKMYKKIKNVKMSGFFFLSFFIPFLIMVLVYKSMGIAPFGEKSILIMDMSDQNVAFFSELRNIIEGHSSIFFSWSKSFGCNFTGDYSYFISSPFSLFIMFFSSEDLPIALMWLTCIKIGFAGFSLTIYFKYAFRKCGIATLVLAICYALMSYSSVYSLSIMWLDGLIWLPLILLGIEKLLMGKFPWLLPICLSIMFISHYYISYMIGIICLLYFLLRYYSKKRNHKKSVKYFLYFAGSVLIAIGLASWLLVPTAINLFDGKLANAAMVQQGIYFSLEEFLPKLMAGKYDTITNEGFPSVFCGLFVLIFSSTYFFNWKINNRERYFSLAILIFLVYSFMSKQLNFVWHAFQYPNWFPFRNAFIFSFFLVFLAFRSITSIPWRKLLEKCIKWKLARRIAVYSTLTLLLVFQAWEMYQNSKDMIMGLDHQFQYKTLASYQDFYNKVAPLVESVEDDEQFFRMEKNFERSKNDAMTFGYKGVTHYSSIFNEQLNQFTKQIGFAQNWMWNSYYGNTPLTDMLFNMRYIMSEKTMSEYYEVLEDSKGITLYENPYTLPVAYMANDVSAIQSEYFTAQNQMMNAISGFDYNYFENCANSYIGDNNYSFTAQKKAPYFLRKPINGGNWGNIYTNSILRGDFYTGENDCIQYIGDYDVGEVVNVSIEGDVSENGLEIVSLDIDKLVEAYHAIQEGGLEVEEYGPQYIKGYVNASVDGIMMTSIPYDKGFRVYVDGEVVETDMAFDTFLCFDVPQGEHDINIRYTAPGATLGAMITIISILLGALVMVLYLKKEKREEK